MAKFKIWAESRVIKLTNCIILQTITAMFVILCTYWLVQWNKDPSIEWIRDAQVRIECINPLGTTNT